MRVEKGKMAASLITVGALLLFFSILIQTGPARHQGPWRLYPKDLAHSLGWMGTVTMAASSSYPFLKRKIKKRMRLSLDVHCLLGAASLPPIVVHLYHRIFLIRSVHMVSFFTFGLMVVIVASGIMLRSRSGNRLVRAYSKVFHVPLSIAFYITLGYHVMQKLAVI